MRDASVPAEPEPAYDNNLESAAAVVAAWCGESLLHAGEDPARALAPGTARRGALDAALREIDMDLARPSAEFRRRFALMLGLERILSEPTPSLASGLTLRAHQVDALAGMLAALIGDFERGEDEEHEDDEAEDDADEAEIAAGVEPRGRGGRRRRRGRRGRRRGARCRRRRGGRRRRRGAGRGSASRSGRAQALPLQAPDRLRQDRRGRGLRRRLPHRRRPDPDAPAPARRPVPARPQGAGLRAAAVGRDRQGPAHPRASARDRRDLRLVHQAPPGPRPRRLRGRALRRGAHRARRAHEREHPQVLEADLHRHDGDGPAAAEARRRRLPRRDRRLPALGRRAPRRRRAAALPARAAGRLAAQRARRRRRLRPGPAGRRARPRGAQHGSGGLLRRPLRRPRGDHLRRRGRARRERRAGAARRRRQGEVGLGQNAPARAGRDARGLRARRDERARERPAAGRGLERAARDDLHAPRADREPPGLPAARRPRDAAAPPQGGRRRRRLRRSRRAALRSHGDAAQPARRRRVPARRPRHAAPPATAAALAEDRAAGRARGRLVRARRRRPRATARGDRGRLEVGRRRHAARRTSRSCGPRPPRAASRRPTCRASPRRSRRSRRRRGSRSSRPAPPSASTGRCASRPSATWPPGIPTRTRSSASSA